MTKRWIKWDNEEIKKLKEMYLKTTLTVEEIANIIDRTPAATAGKLMGLSISRTKDAPNIRHEMRVSGLKKRLPYSEKTKYKMGSANRGKSPSKEIRDKISKSLKGKKPWNTGKKLTEEHKEKIRKSTSEALMGHTVSEETREKIRQHHLKNKISVGIKNPMYGIHLTGEKSGMSGKHLSDEAKQKIGKANMKYPELSDKEWLFKKYITENTSSTLIATKLGCCPGSVLIGLRRCGIRVRSLSEALKGKIVSEETRKKMSGKNHPCWKGGITNKKFLDGYGMETKEWIKLTKKIRKRDNYICQYCGECPAYEVHHILPRNIKIDNHPYNIITLCKSCHSKVEKLTDKYIEQNRDAIEVFYDKWSTQ